MSKVYFPGSGEGYETEEECNNRLKFLTDVNILTTNIYKSFRVVKCDNDGKYNDGKYRIEAEPITIEDKRTAKVETPTIATHTTSRTTDNNEGR